MERRTGREPQKVKVGHPQQTPPSYSAHITTPGYSHQTTSHSAEEQKWVGLGRSQAGVLFKQSQSFLCAQEGPKSSVTATGLPDKAYTPRLQRLCSKERQMKSDTPFYTDLGYSVLVGVCVSRACRGWGAAVGLQGWRPAACYGSSHSVDLFPNVKAFQGLAQTWLPRPEGLSRNHPAGQWWHTPLL